MKESTTYQEIIREGFEEGRKTGQTEGTLAVLLRLGSRTLGRPGAGVKARLKEISDLRRLEHLIESIALGSAKTWDELLRKTV